MLQPISAAALPVNQSSMQVGLLAKVPRLANTPEARAEARNTLGVMLRGEKEIVATDIALIASQLGPEELNKPDSATGFTALSTAIINDREELVALLQKAGASLDSKNDDGSTAEHLRTEKNGLQNMNFVGIIRADPATGRQFSPYDKQKGFEVNFQRMCNVRHIEGKQDLDGNMAAYLQETPPQRAANYMMALKLYVKDGATINAFNQPAPGTYGLDKLNALQTKNPGLHGIRLNDMTFNALMNVASLGQVMRLQRMVALGADIDAREPVHGWAALHACTAAPTERLKIDSQETNENNLFHATKTLIDSGADIRVRSHEGDEPLHGAAAFRSTETLQYMLDHGARADAKNDLGVTPLHRAAASGNAAAIKVLVEAGGDLDAQDSQGRTPRAMAELAQKDLVGVEYAVERTRLLKTFTAIDQLQLARATAEVATAPAPAPELRPVDEMFLTVEDAPGLVGMKLNALQHAAGSGDLEQLTEAIKRGANLDLPEASQGWTAIQIAVNAGNLSNLEERSKIVTALAERGAEVNLVEANGMHLIHQAARFCAPDAIKALKAAGADMNATNNKGFKPLTFAAVTGKPETFRALLEVGARLDLAGLEQAEKFVKAGLPVNHPGKQEVLELIAAEKIKLEAALI